MAQKHHDESETIPGLNPHTETLLWRGEESRLGSWYTLGP